MDNQKWVDMMDWVECMDGMDGWNGWMEMRNDWWNDGVEV